MRFCVTIHNDEEHSFNYVIRLFTKAFNINHNMAFALAKRINALGKASIEVSDFESAEKLRCLLVAPGPDRLVKFSSGPLNVTIDQHENLDCIGRWTNQSFLPGAELQIQTEKEKLDTTPLAINGVGILFALLALALEHFFKIDIQMDALRTVSKCAAIVFFLWSAVVYMRPILKARRSREPFLLPFFEFIFVGTEIIYVIQFA
jgi:ATP-dependent Clp protease adaptor protein ClpS